MTINAFSADPISHKDIEEFLEAAMDSQGSAAILTALVNICHDKAEHLRSNWANQSAWLYQCAARSVPNRGRLPCPAEPQTD